MADAEIFVASAITIVGMLGFFTYLYHHAGGWLWKRVWMLSAFLSIYFQMGILRKAFQNILVINDLADLTFGVMMILQWVIVLLIGWLFLSLLYAAVRKMIHAAEGRAPEPDEVERGAMR